MVGCAMAFTTGCATSRRVECVLPMLAPPVPDANEPALLPLVAVGDVDAIRQVIAVYGGLIWSMARRFEPDDAEDAVQEIFLDLWKSAARYDAQRARETTFVAVLARRRLIDRRRRQRLQRTAETSDVPLPTLVDSAPLPDVAAEAALAARAIETLSPDQRKVLLLSICHGLSHGEIATRLDMPLGTVKAHARRGLIAVRAALAGNLGEQP
jgi:RNA polymerase sigma-70 factor, ECF subfamily